jgi:hypothetical protein
MVTTHSRHSQCKHLPVTATRFLHNSLDTLATISCTAHLSAFILFTSLIAHIVTYLHLFVCSVQYFVSLLLFCAVLCLTIIVPCSTLSHYYCSVQYFVSLLLFCAVLCLTIIVLYSTLSHYYYRPLFVIF